MAQLKTAGRLRRRFPGILWRVEFSELLQRIAPKIGRSSAQNPARGSSVSGNRPRLEPQTAATEVLVIDRAKGLREISSELGILRTGVLPSSETTSFHLAV